MAWHISNRLFENWRSSQGPEAVSLAESCSDGKPSVQSNGSLTPLLYLPPDRMKAFSRLSRYGMTFRPLTEDLGADLLTWYLAASHAKTSAQPEREQASPESAAGCGRTWRGSLARYDPGSCSWRTAQCSLHGDLALFSETWPRWGTMRNGESSKQQTWEQTMHEDDSLYYAQTRSNAKLPTPSGTSNHGKNHVSGRIDEWGGSSNRFRGTEIGKLHCPRFEEWLMGWPDQWTELMPSGMDKFQRWCALHGQSCTKG